jgi:serine/threonine-protein kinase
MVARGISPDDVLAVTKIVLCQAETKAVPWDELPIPKAVAAENELVYGDKPAKDSGQGNRDEEGHGTSPQDVQKTSLAPVDQRNEHVSPQHSFPPPPNAIAMVPQTAELPPGSILVDKYLIQSVVGKGGMAIVFRALHLMMDRTVAIKMLLPEIAKDDETVARFQREAKAASALRHPNVITIYDYGISPEGQPFIVMDFLNGKSLEELLEQQGKMPLARAIPILAQACDALSIAHQCGIVHRDVKPSNIMVEDTLVQRDFVRLVDFGIAKAAGQDAGEQKLTKTGQVFGSLVYMSPEQCLGKQLDSRSDIYSFGCVIYEVFTCISPFLGETIFDTMSKHINSEPPFLQPLIENIPCAARLQEIFFKAVAKDPGDRYQTMLELKKDLLAVL